MTRKYSTTSVETTLASGLSSNATTMTVASATASSLLGGVTLAVGNVDQFTVAIDADTANEEIVFVTAVSSDTLTIVRGRAGSSAITHTGGASVKHVLTSNDLDFFNTGVENAATLVGTQTLSNKTIALGSNTITGTTAQFNTALTDNDFATVDGAATLTNKTVALGSNTLTGTTAQFNAALTDNDFATLAGTSTLTNKTISDAVITGSVNAQTGTTYTTVLTDAKQIITLSNASAITVTLPPASSVAYLAGSKIDFIQKDAGQVTFAQGAGVTIRSVGATATAPKLRTQYSAATAWYEGSDVWYIVGDIN